MPTISRAYHAHSGNYTPGGNSCRYIVVHNTGNTAPARNEASYAQNNQHPSSYHYVLDGGGTIYQVLSDSDTAWAVGAWAGARQLIGNNESISIEVCSDGTEFTEAEQQELTWLVQMLMAKWGIPADRVVRHWDCHTGRKNCPAYYSGASNPAWDALHERITGGDMEPIDVWAYKNKDVNPDYVDVYDMLTRCTKAAEKIDEGVPVDIDYDELADKVAALIGDRVAAKVADLFAKRLQD